MAKDVQNTQPVRRSYHVKRGAVKCESGLGTRYLATAIFNPTANTGERTIAAHGPNDTQGCVSPYLYVVEKGSLAVDVVNKLLAIFKK